MDLATIVATLTDFLNQIIEFINGPEFADAFNSIVEFIKGLIA